MEVVLSDQMKAVLADPVRREKLSIALSQLGEHSLRGVPYGTIVMADDPNQCCPVRRSFWQRLKAALVEFAR